MGLSNVFLPAIAGGVLGGIGQGASAIAQDALKREQMAREAAATAETARHNRAMETYQQEANLLEMPVAQVPAPFRPAGAVEGGTIKVNKSLLPLYQQFTTDQQNRQAGESAASALLHASETPGVPGQRTAELAPGEDEEASAFLPRTVGTPPTVDPKLRALAAVIPSLYKNPDATKAVIEAVKPQPLHALGDNGLYDPNTKQVIGGGPPASAPEPPVREGYVRTYHQDAKGRQTYSDAIKPTNEQESAIRDYIAANPKKFTGMSDAAARDAARAALDTRKVTTRVDINQPGLSNDAVDRAADYVNQTGQLPGNLGFGNPRLRAQILDRAAQLARQAGGDLGLAAQQANYKANQSELTRLQSQRGPVLAFANTAEKNLALAEQLSAAVDRTQIPVLNKWILSGQQNWAGDPRVASLAAATRTAINEYAKVTNSATGGGVSSDAARKEIEGILSAAQTPEQFRSVVQTLRAEMGNRVRGYDEQIAATQARIKGLAGGAPSPLPTPAAPRATKRFNPATGTLEPIQ